MPYSLTRNRAAFLAVGDALLIALSLVLAIELRFFSQPVPLDIYQLTFVIIIPLYLIIFIIADAYNIELNFRTSYYAARHLLTVSVATMSAAVGMYVLPSWKFGRGLILLSSICIYLLTFIWRIIFQSSILPIRKRRIIVIGAGRAGAEIADVLTRSQYFALAGLLDDDKTKWSQAVKGNLVLGGTDRLDQLVREHQVDALVVAIASKRSDELLSKLLDAKLEGLDIYDMPSLCEDLTGKLPASHLSPDWLISVPFAGMRRSMYKMRIKRFLDLLLSATGLVVTAPAVLLAAICIKLDSRGPILYRQQRVGLYGKVFELYKLRTMVSDAEKHGAVWARQNDNRVTRVGRVLRYLRVDEIPQMWNVLRGDMSFIGPRPERPEFEQRLQRNIPLYTLRHAVYPGITGWAQINYRYGASTEDAFEKLQYDLYYLKRMSFLLDLQILLKTIRVVLMGSGAR